MYVRRLRCECGLGDGIVTHAVFSSVYASSPSLFTSPLSPIDYESFTIDRMITRDISIDHLES